MPWDNTNGWTISTPEQALRRYYDSMVTDGYAGTWDEFRQGKYGALYYSAAQQDVRQETELSLIFERTKDFYRDSNALIRTNNLNPVEIQQTFLNQLGLEVALKRNALEWAVAIDYEPSAGANQQIAALMASELFGYGVPITGDIVQSYQAAPDKQAFDIRWTQSEDQSLDYRITITKVDDNTAPELTLNEIRALFLELHAERVVWGNIIQPQRILTEVDLAFATSVVVEVRRLEDEAAWQTTPLELEYFQKPIPILDTNNISITTVNPIAGL